LEESSTIVKEIRTYNSVLVKHFQSRVIVGLLGPYTTSVASYCYLCNSLIILLCPYSPHVVIIMPHRSPLLLLLCPYNIIVI